MMKPLRNAKRNTGRLAAGLAAVFLTALTSGLVKAQQPGWSVNPNEFAGSMSVTSVLVLEGSQDSRSGDRVGAFVNGQARGTAGPIRVGGKQFFFVTVFGQTDGERVSFRYYSEADGVVHGVFETATFVTDRILGSTTTPFLLTANVATGVEADVVEVAQLGPNYPEPFRDRTTIPYSLASPAAVRLEVFNLLGRRVATIVDGSRPAGSHVATFFAGAELGSLASGLYLYRLSTPDGTVTRTMTVAD